jgi:AraC-like DNA-binding protein
MVLFSPGFFVNSEERSSFLQHSSLFQSPYVILKPRSPEMIHLLTLYFSLMKQRPGKKIKIDLTILLLWLHNLLIVLQREHDRQQSLSKGDDDENYLRQFKKLLNKHYATEKQVCFYAGKLGLPERKLSRLVFVAHGINAKELISETVLRAAIHLVNHTTLTHGEIADRLGLDFTYFVKFFRKHTGLTPAKYRSLHNSHLLHQETGVHVLGDSSS